MSSGSPQPYEVSYDPNLNRIVYAFQSGWIIVPATAESTPPGGSNTDVQFNNNGSFGGDSGLTYSSGLLTATALKSASLTAPASLLTIKPTTDSQNAIQFTNAAISGQPIISIDTNTHRVGLGTSTPGTFFVVEGETAQGGPLVVGGNHAAATCAIDINQASALGYGLGLGNISTANLATLTPNRTGNMVYVTDVSPGVYVNNGSTWSQVGSGSGLVLQMLSTTSTAQDTTTSGTFVVASDYTVTITPHSTASRFLIQVNGVVSLGSGAAAGNATIMRNSTVILGSEGFGGFNLDGTEGGGADWGMSMSVVDSPATVSPITYAIGISGLSGGEMRIGDSNVYGSTITVTEFAS